MAGALGLSLGGPRVYDGVRVDDAAMGSGRWNATAADVRRALALYRTADAVLIAFIAVLAAAAIAPSQNGRSWEFLLRTIPFDRLQHS